MYFKLSPVLVKSSLSAHSMIGLIVSVLMYLICLTGTLAVFAEAFERWEQPDVAEFSDYQSSTIENAISGFLAKVDKPPESLYVVLPTSSMPRMHVSAGEQEWYLELDGTLGAQPVEGWTHLLRELHFNLHLPHTPGVVMVGVIGVMLLALIFSGLLAHPSIFKDAFRFRKGGSRRLEQVDLHNRLSVWGLPFHLMIGVTGAFFGLVVLVAFVASSAFYNGDRDALMESVYGADPVVGAPVQVLDIRAAFNSLKTQAPTATPIYIVVQKLGTREQFMEIAATLPGRLIYSEMYRFNANGEYLNHQGLSDGPVARQIIYSVYRIHFGHYGGLLVKIAYVLLGLALTVICVSGVNIWLERCGGQNWVNGFWCATVWGTPTALAIAAFLSVLFSISATVTFVIAWIGAIVLCIIMHEKQRRADYLKKICAGTLSILVVGYYLRFPGQMYNSLALTMNSTLLLLAVILLFIGTGTSKARIC